MPPSTVCYDYCGCYSCKFGGWCCFGSRKAAGSRTGQAEGQLEPNDRIPDIGGGSSSRNSAAGSGQTYRSTEELQSWQGSTPQSPTTVDSGNQSRFGSGPPSPVENRTLTIDELAEKEARRRRYEERARWAYPKLDMQARGGKRGNAFAVDSAQGVEPSGSSAGPSSR